jgi:hypothetical protein
MKLLRRLIFRMLFPGLVVILFAAFGALVGFIAGGVISLLVGPEPLRSALQRPDLPPTLLLAAIIGAALGAIITGGYGVLILSGDFGYEYRTASSKTDIINGALRAWAFRGVLCGGAFMLLFAIILSLFLDITEQTKPVSVWLWLVGLVVAAISGTIPGGIFGAIAGAMIGAFHSYESA